MVEPTVRNLVFKDIPDKHVAAFAEGVIATLDKLGYTFEYDETGLGDVTSHLVYTVFDVRLEPEKVVIQASDVGEMPKELFE